MPSNLGILWTFLEQMAQDTRYALRAMAANPLFTATAALSLALGIGANTAIFSFMDAILMRSLPVPHPEQLAILEWHAPRRPAVVRSINGSSRRWGKTGASSPNFPYQADELCDPTGSSSPRYSPTAMRVIST